MTTTELPIFHDNGYKVMIGWRVGQSPEESTTRSGLLVPVGTKDGNDALALVDVLTGQRFWAVPTGAWRFIWPPTGKPVSADGIETFRFANGMIVESWSLFSPLKVRKEPAAPVTPALPPADPPGWVRRLVRRWRKPTTTTT